MPQRISDREWQMAASAVDAAQAFERASQQRVFRLVQALGRGDTQGALKALQAGAGIDEPLKFDVENDGVPGALELLPPEFALPNTGTPVPPPLTPLAIAAIKNDRDATQWLLDNGALVGTVLSAGRDAAWFAIENRASDCYRLLMEQGAWPALILSDSSRRTRLMAAVLVRDEHAVGDLLRRRVKVNQYDRAGRTALHHNLAQVPYTDEDAVIARLLLAEGANPNVEDNDGIPAHALAKTDEQKALMDGYRIGAVTDEVRRKIEEAAADPVLLDPATDPGLPQIRRPRPPRPRL